MFVTGPMVILALKIAVAAVTVLLLSSLVALARGNVRLHGRINLVFFILTLIAVLGLELIIRVSHPEVREYIYGTEERRYFLNIHLCFSVPSTILMPLMLYTGLSGWRTAHLTLAFFFSLFWAGTFVTGIFFLQ